MSAGCTVMPLAKNTCPAPLVLSMPHSLVCAESVDLVLLQPARRGQPAVHCLGPGESEGLARAAAAKLSQPVLTLVADTAAS